MTDELMTAPASEAVIGPVGVSRRTVVRFAAAFLAGLLAATAIGAGALYAFDRQYEGRILPGVRVGGVDVSGLSPAEASARLGEAFASFGEGQIVLTAPGRDPMTIPYAKLDRRPDVEAMVAEAMATGRAGNPVERAILDARTAIKGVDLVPRVLFDEVRLERYIQNHAGRLYVDAKDASVAFVEGAFKVTNGIFGRRTDRLGPTEILTAALAETDAPSEIRVAFEMSPVEPDVTTEEAEAALETAELMALDVAIAEGDESWTIPAATVRSWIAFGKAPDGSYAPEVQPEAVAASLAEVAKQVERKPRNAGFTTSGSRITGVTAAQNGRALDVATTATLVDELLTSRASGDAGGPITPALTTTTPALTTEAAEAALPKMTRISTWTTYFPISEKNGFGANIWIPAIDIDGYVVAPGATFDFWQAVGPVTRERGYRDGGAIINGKTEPQGALAGGICSCSTTLFNAALRAGFEMGARRNHYYYIDRYPLGLDATVFKSGSGSVQTMSWVNDTEYPVLIRGYKIRDGGAGYVRFDLYSVPTGRKVSFSRPVVKNVRPASDSVQYTTTLAPGARKRIEYPVAGKDVWVTRTVRDASGKVIHQETYYSHYARITGIVLVGR